MTVTGEQKLRLKSGRKPLQLLNSQAISINTETTIKPKPGKQECIEIQLVGDVNKENDLNPVVKMEPLDASLAEELSAIRKKLERLRADKEKTDKMLNEREKLMDMQMKEIKRRGEIQKMFEIEVDRLYRLKELQSYCMRISSIRSLREKEQEKKISEPSNSQESKEIDKEESMGENMMQSPCSTSSEAVSQTEN